MVEAGAAQAAMGRVQEYDIRRTLEIYLRPVPRLPISSLPMLFASPDRDLVNAASYFRGLSVLGCPEDPASPTFQFDVNIGIYYCADASAPVHTVLRCMSTATLNCNPTLLTALPTGVLLPGNGKAGNITNRKPQPKKKTQPARTTNDNNGAPEPKSKPKAKPKPKAKQKSN